MIADHLTGIEQFEADLWKVADTCGRIRILASNEYFYAHTGPDLPAARDDRYYEAMAVIEGEMIAGRMPERPLVEADFTRRRALMLPEAARYDVSAGDAQDGNLGAAVTAAMEIVENHFPPLAGQLPKDYERFEDDVLERDDADLRFRGAAHGLGRRVRPRLRVFPRGVLETGRTRQR